MRFDSFIILAEMRTGSNFLEANLNLYDGITSHGELFNPHFIGFPGREQMLGLTQEERDADPAAMFAKLRAQVGVAGFRFFHDHDPRALQIALEDPRCAKVVLTRNPADSYVSLKIARATGQWKLTDAKKRKAQQALFDPAEFATHLQDTQAFQIQILTHLQRSAQTAFYIAYEDLRDLEALNGLARWLGSPETRDSLDSSLKPQNPQPLLDKVTNPDEMAEALARLDRFNLTRTPNFEPRRGPVVPSYVAAPCSGLLYQGIRGGPEAAVTSWLAALDEAAPEEVQSGFTRSTLRQWQNAHPGHRSFTVLRHPLARIHATYCEKILSTGPGSYVEIRDQLKRFHKVPLTQTPEAPSYDYQSAFAAFLGFVARNLHGQTGIRVDPYWSSQAVVIEGFARLRAPDMILREAELEEGLAVLAAQAGHDVMPAIEAPTDPYAARLEEIYDPQIEKLARAAYGADYHSYGFGDWRPEA